VAVGGPAALRAAVGYFGADRQLYVVAVLLFLIKAVAIPRLLRRVAQRFTAGREPAAYVNTGTSLVVSGLLVLLAYAQRGPSKPSRTCRRGRDAAGNGVAGLSASS